MVLYTPEQLEDMLWYFAHPYTVKDKDGRENHQGEHANFIQACTKTSELIKRGFNVYSPIAHTHPVHIIEPQFIKNEEYKLWVRLDNLIIDKTNFKGIILAPRWETSGGCNGEREKFEKRNLQVLLYNDIIKDQPILYDVSH